MTPCRKYRTLIKHRNYQISFVVTAQGKIAEMRDVKGYNDVFTQELFTILLQLPHWVPSQMNGRNIHTSMLLYVSYKS